ncbi:MAG: NADH-quinone oxidoreductase subunit M [Rubrivivax sp.]|nr:NADH-quinone oxidoreductase subunit M [Rubrivivax sp.]
MLLNEVLAAQQIGFPILSALVGVPLLGLLLLGVAPARSVRSLALATAAAELVLTLLMLAAFRTGSADLQFVERWGGFFTLGVDGLSALFLPLTAVLTLLAVLSSEAAVKVGVRGYLMALLGFQATVMGVLVAADVLLFWLFLTLEIVPSWMLIARHGTGNERRHAALHYAVVMAVSAVLLGAGIALLVTASGGSDLKTVLATRVPDAAQGTIFLLLLVGLGIKAPLFPLHAWLPRVLDQGPVVGAGVFLVGVKLGTYGLLRLVIPVLPEAAAEYYWLVALLAGLGIVYGALIALVQQNLRRLLAYASLSHMGVVLLGLFSLNSYGLQGGLLQMLCLGMAVAGLFFIAGFLYERVGPPELPVLGGLRQRMPLLSTAFLVIALGAVGMPGTSGFNGEHLVLIGAYKVHWAMALFVGAGTVLGAAYFLLFYQRAFLGQEPADSTAALPDLNLREKTVCAVMAALVLGVGLYTSPFVAVTQSSVKAVAEHVQTRIQTQRVGAALAVPQTPRQP